jgi:hypothetical protein
LAGDGNSPSGSPVSGLSIPLNLWPILSRLSIRAHVRKLGRSPTAAQKLELCKKRELLQTRIDGHRAKAATFLGDVELPDLDFSSEEFDHDESWEDDDDGSAVPEDVFMPEKTKLLLPSELGTRLLTNAGLSKLIKTELDLRIGQANDALHGIRIAVGQKSVHFRTQVRNAKTQSRKTRAWDGVNALEVAIKQYSAVYSAARRALVHLGASAEVLKKYKLLRRDDLRASTLIVDPNIPGQRNAKLSWFWSIDVNRDTLNNSWMQECL